MNLIFNPWPSSHAMVGGIAMPTLVLPRIPDADDLERLVARCDALVLTAQGQRRQGGLGGGLCFLNSHHDFGCLACP